MPFSAEHFRVCWAADIYLTYYEWKFCHKTMLLRILTFFKWVYGNPLTFLVGIRRIPAYHVDYTTGWIHLLIRQLLTDTLYKAIYIIIWTCNMYYIINKSLSSFISHVPSYLHVKLALHRLNFKRLNAKVNPRWVTGQGHFRGQSDFSWGRCPSGPTPRSATASEKDATVTKLFLFLLM